MNRKEKIQLLKDLQAGRKQIADTLKPDYSNLSTDELTVLLQIVSDAQSEKKISLEDERTFDRLYAKLYTI